MKFFLYDVINVEDKPIIEVIQSLITMVLMALLTILVYYGNIPNPNLILFTGLIAVSSLFGYIPGAFALAGVYIYTLLFFSTNQSFIYFTEINATKTVVSFVSGALCYLFVSTLNNMYKRSAKRMIHENTLLHATNMNLREMSHVDALTQTKNRFALRKDFESYIGAEIDLMIFDIDNFKNINDTYGHSFGDEMLRIVGQKVKETFGEEYCYRFGGDEFVVISKDDSVTSFTDKIEDLMKLTSKIVIEGKEIDVCLSAGFTYGVPTNTGDLRLMIKSADELLYKIKKNGKNNYEGIRYDLDIQD